MSADTYDMGGTKHERTHLVDATWIGFHNGLSDGAIVDEHLQRCRLS